MPGAAIGRRIPRRNAARPLRPVRRIGRLLQADHRRLRIGGSLIRSKPWMCRLAASVRASLRVITLGNYLRELAFAWYWGQKNRACGARWRCSGGGRMTLSQARTTLAAPDHNLMRRVNRWRAPAGCAGGCCSPRAPAMAGSGAQSASRCFVPPDAMRFRASRSGGALRSPPAS